MTGALFAWRRGEGGEALVLLHGFGFCHRAWLPVVAALPEDQPLLAFDLPGHAGSLQVGGHHARQMAQAVARQLPGAGRFHLAGHSMGGAVAALIAMAMPGRIASLTLLAPGGFGPQINHPLIVRYAAARARPDLERALAAMFAPNRAVPSPLVEDLLAMRAAGGQSAALEAMAAGMARNGVQGTLDCAALAELPMPVKVLWGSLDHVLPVAQADGLPAGVVVHRFAGVGHMLPHEIPLEVAALLREQLR